MAFSDEYFMLAAIEMAQFARVLNQKFNLQGHTLYSSAEPCVMCSGPIKWARISKVIFSVSQSML